MEKDLALSDDELMVRGAEGNEEAFRLLVERWQNPVFAFLSRMLDSPEEAQDLGQEAFLRVCREADRYRPEGKFRSWLFRIAGNLARSRLRRRRVLEWVRFDPERHNRHLPGEPSDRRLEREETGRMVRGALARLPERQRMAVVLQHYHQLSYVEIAEAMKTSVSSVQSLLHRGMLALRRELDHEEH
jgi:RNA polymerase sigma-70 factor (ECF subfamily)